MKLMAGVCAAMAISTVGLIGQAQAPVQTRPGTEPVTPQVAITARNLTEDVTTVGCVRAWMPATADVTRLPENREPGMAGMFLLTPLASGPTTATEIPTYLLTPSASVNFHQHLDRKVEVVGVAQTAPTIQGTVTVSTQLPENKIGRAHV